ncbi:MAG: 30S ribosomal protein S12 methylthiotransferase RimO [Candidatus Krumholzibacteriia bacterium]
MSRSRARRVWVHTLGCDKNLVDSEALLGHFAARGVAVAADPETADVWVLNTCGFIAAARADSWAALAELVGAKGRQRTLVAMGCLAQEHAAEIAARFPTVDVVAGVGNFDAVVDAVLGGTAGPPVGPAATARYDGFADRPLLTPPHVAFVKIAEGCGCNCSFCRIPRIRGPLRSRPAAGIVAEATALAARGVREIQLVSQNTSDWGRDFGGDLVSLVAALGAVPDLRWIRLLYLYPGHLSVDAARRLLALPKVVPYLDLPIQHASPAVLRAMRRPSDAGAMADFFLRLRAERPELVLRTTVLLGFPGETEDDVETLADFLARVEFDQLGTYRYSPEPGTPAAALPDRVPDEEVADREARLLDLQAEVALRRQQRRLGGVFPAVVDAVVPAADAAETVDALREGEWAPGWNRTRVAVVGDAAGPVALARTVHYGYDLDGVVVLDGEGRQPGEWLTTELVAVTPWDALGVVRPDGNRNGGGAACEPV